MLTAVATLTTGMASGPAAFTVSILTESTSPSVVTGPPPILLVAGRFVLEEPVMLEAHGLFDGEQGHRVPTCASRQGCR